MSRDDPFETWHIDPELKRSISPQRRAQLDAEARTALDELQQFLDHPPSRGNFGDVRIGLLPESYGLPPDQVLRAQDLYRRVVAVGGAGNTYVQENLLELLAATEDPTSIPFWLDIVNLARPRDSFATKRRTYAVAALARLAIRGNPTGTFSLPETYAALCIATPLRTWQLRALLRVSENPVPLDNPGGAYAFKVKYKWVKGITRTIELKSEQTLWDLHRAIQRALQWGDDHLYSFFMNGQKWDQRYTFASPYEEDHPPWADEAVIGELGLMLKHKFLHRNKRFSAFTTSPSVMEGRSVAASWMPISAFRMNTTNSSVR